MVGGGIMYILKNKIKYFFIFIIIIVLFYFHNNEKFDLSSDEINKYQKLENNESAVYKLYTYYLFQDKIDKACFYNRRFCQIKNISFKSCLHPLCIDIKK